MVIKYFRKKTPIVEIWWGPEHASGYIPYSVHMEVFNEIFFFSIWVFFHDYSRITGLQGKGEGISFSPHYQFHPLHRNLDISH